MTGSDGVTGDATFDLPVGYVAHQLTHPLTVGRHPVNDEDYFAGQVDDLWIAHRVANDCEKAGATWHGFSSPSWLADVERVGSGELLTLDGDFDGLSGVTHALAYGTEGSTYHFVDTGGISRVSRPGVLVRHQQNRNCTSELDTSEECRLAFVAPAYAGSLHAVSAQATLTENLLAPRYNRFWIVDELGAENSSQIDTANVNANPP